MRTRMPLIVLALVAVAAMAVLSAQPQLPVQLPTEITAIRHNSGQPVIPYFEGWIRNPRRHARPRLRLLQPELRAGVRDSGRPGESHRAVRPRRRPADVFPSATAAVHVPRQGAGRLRQERAGLVHYVERTNRARVRQPDRTAGDHRARGHDERQLRSRPRRSEQAAHDQRDAAGVGVGRGARNVHRIGARRWPAEAARGACRATPGATGPARRVRRADQFVGRRRRRPALERHVGPVPGDQRRSPSHGLVQSSWRTGRPR